VGVEQRIHTRKRACSEQQLVMHAYVDKGQHQMRNLEFIKFNIVSHRYDGWQISVQCKGGINGFIDHANP
jgi:hypothetical protein